MSLITSEKWNSDGGGINLIEKGDIVWITQVIIGLVTVILNLLGKVETESS